VANLHREHQGLEKSQSTASATPSAFKRPELGKKRVGERRGGVRDVAPAKREGGVLEIDKGKAELIKQRWLPVKTRRERKLGVTKLLVYRAQQKIGVRREVLYVQIGEGTSRKRKCTFQKWIK